MPGPNDAFDLSAEMADIPGGQVVESFNPNNPPIEDPAGGQTSPPGEQAPVQPVDWFDSAKPVFKELLEEEPESLDALKTKITAERTELKELREKIKKSDPELVNTINARLTALEAENNELLEAVNPLAHFRSEDAYRAEQLARKFPDVNPGAIQRIMNSDLDKMGVVDAIRLHLEFTYGITSPDEQKEWIEDKYGVDVTEEDFVPKAMMKTDAVDFKKKLKEVKVTDIPQVKDYKATKEQRVTETQAKYDKLTADWNPIVEKAVKSLGKITIPFKDAEGKDDPLEFIVEEASLIPYVKMVTDTLAKGGKELSEDNLRGAMSSVYQRILAENLQKITAAHTNRKLAELDDRWARETNNPRKINQQQKPPVQQEMKPNSKEAAEAKIMSDW